MEQENNIRIPPEGETGVSTQKLDSDTELIQKQPAKLNIRLLWFVIALTVFFSDQFTKALVVQFLEEGERVSVIKNLFYFTHVQNKGAAFGMFADMADGWRELMLLSLGGIALVLVVIYSIRLLPTEKLSQLALHMVFAGAIGNLTDRLTRGSVTDFILFRQNSWSFPAFNIADSAIVIGVGLLLIDTLRPKKKTAKAPVKVEVAENMTAIGSIAGANTMTMELKQPDLKADSDDTITIRDADTLENNKT